MSQKSKPQLPVNDTSEDFPHLNFIVVETEIEDYYPFIVSKELCERIESVNLRPNSGKLIYKNGPEDKFIDEDDTDFYYSATVDYQKNTGVYYVHVTHMGRLYFATTLLHVADIIKSLLVNEASKIIK